MKKVIISADDFGMAESVDLGIIKGHREGVITSASFLACGPSAEHAAALAKENPGLGVGLHLCLTRERPVSDPAYVPSLAPSGVMPANSALLVLGIKSGRITKTHIVRELRAQMRRAAELGVHPTHADGHEHVHVLPGVFGVFMKMTVEFGIFAVRYPVGPSVGWFGLSAHTQKLALQAVSMSRLPRLRRHNLKTPDRLFGVEATGRLDAEYLLKALEMLPDGVSEIMCHPGLKNEDLAREKRWGFGWETELGAVLDERVGTRLKSVGAELISYRDL